MSHFTTIRTMIRNQLTLEETLKELHYTYRSEESIRIRGYQGQNAHGQVVVDTGSSYDIGFQRQSDQTYAVCSDWWGVENNTSIRQVEFLRSLNQTYTIRTVRQQVLEAGHLIECEQLLENGQFQIVVCERE